MGKYKRYKNRIEKFLSGDSGKRFFNFAYSIGAAIVIWGALFKILHLPGGNLMLSIGMGVEVLMFVLTAFDRPAKEYHWEEVFPVLDTNNPDDRPEFNGGGGGVVITGTVSGAAGAADGVSVSGADARRIAGIPSNIDVSEEDTRNLSESIQKLSAAAEQISHMAELTEATQNYLNQMAAITEQMTQFRQATQSLTEVSDTLLRSYRSITDNSDGIGNNTQGYITQMEALNRNISGLNTIYEIQLKSISSQLDNIDRVNAGLRNIRDMYEGSMQDSSRYCAEVEKMTQYMAQLNSVYRNMLTAMTVNMYTPQPTPPVQSEKTVIPTEPTGENA